MLRRDAAVWVLGTSSLLIKHVTVFGVWMLLVSYFGWRRGALLMTGSLAIFTLSFAPYLPQGAERIVQRVLLYQSWPGYGVSAFLPRPFAAMLFYAAMLSLPLVAQRVRLDVADALLLAALAHLVFIYGLGSQMFALLIPWAYIRPSRWLAPFTLAVCLLVNPWRPLEMSQPNTNTLAWLTLVPWLAWFIYRKLYAIRSLNRG